MTATAKAKTKFSSRNLNAVYKAPLAKATDHGGGYHSLSRMLVLKSSSAGRSSVLTAPSLSVAAPAPINTPSLRKENNGQDVHVHLVPTGKVGWGTSPTSNSHSNNADERKPRPHGGEERSNAPFSSSQRYRSESAGHQVWGTGLSSSLQHHGKHSAQRRPAATSARSFGSSGVIFGMSTGRWGDDAVEQDIARSDMLCARQKEREFPQLKDNCDAADQRFSGDHINNNHSYDQDHRPRYDQYEADHRGSAEYSHENRLSGRGCGLERPRANAYGCNNNNNQSGCYHPSDARYDNLDHAPPAYHQYPDSHERHHDSYRREYHHQQDRAPNSCFGEDDITRNQQRQYQIERRGCNAEPTKETHFMPHREDNQSSSQELMHDRAAKQQSPPSDSPQQVNASLSRQSLDDTGRATNGTNRHQSVPTSVWKKVDSDFTLYQSPDAQLPVRSSSIHPSSNFAGRSLSTTVPHRPSYVVTPVQPAAPVRILKRDGPRMLFDPKTGRMVNAEDTRSSSRSQRPPAASSSASETEPSNSSRESTSSTALSRSQKAASSVAEQHHSEKTTGAKRIAHARPDQIQKRSLDDKAVAVVAEKRSEPDSLPEGSEERKPEPKTPVTLHLKSVRVKKAQAAADSKKGTIKAKAKKCVRVYRPVVKPASEAPPVAAGVALAPLSMKKFSELFTTSAASADAVKCQLVQTPARAATSTIFKPSKKQIEYTSIRTERSSRRIAKAQEHHAQHAELTKDRKVIRVRAESSVSDGSSARSSHASMDDQPTSMTSPIPAGREETRKLHHGKIRNGVDIDMFKQIPERGGVVVLTDTQVGIEFVVDEDSTNQFETVRSRRALLLEKKQIRESTGAPKSSAPYPRRATFNGKQGAESGIVMLAPGRSAKRTLVLGIRAARPKVTNGEAAEPSVQSEAGAKTVHPSVPVGAQELAGEQAEAPREQQRRNCTPPERKARKSLKPAVTKRVVRGPPSSTDAAECRQEQRVSAHLPASQLAAATEHQRNGGERSSSYPSAKPTRKQRDKSERAHQKVHPIPPSARARVEKTEALADEPKPASLHLPRRKSENSRAPQQPQEAKSQRSSNGKIAAAPVKMKYVSKVSKAVNSGEVVKSEAREPKSLCLAGQAVTTESAESGTGAGKIKPHKAKQTAKSSATNPVAPPTTPTPSASKVKEPKHKLAHRTSSKSRPLAPGSEQIAATSPEATENKFASRKVSSTVMLKTLGVKSMSTDERPQAFNKRLSKSRADLQTAPAVVKSYKRIYVVKKSSSSPAPTSTAA